jgi:Protein of unknown function (DUF3619)
VKTRPTPPLTAAQREALEARFALRLSARLETGTQSLPHDISERLRVAREQAIHAARDARLAAATSTVPQTVNISVAGLSHAGVGTVSGWNESAQSRTRGHGRRLDDGPTSWGWRLASALPVLALLLGLWGIHQYTKHEQVQAATDVDMALLTDDLPPTAYSDAGFAEYLRSDTGPTVRALEAAPPEADGNLNTTDTAPAVSTP